MKPPFSHRFLASVPDGKSNSGLYNISTNNESSAKTKGFNKSSNNRTISCNPSIILRSILINCNYKFVNSIFFFSKLQRQLTCDDVLSIFGDFAACNHLEVCLDNNDGGFVKTVCTLLSTCEGIAIALFLAKK